MRRLTLGSLILGGGILFSLPFRRPEPLNPAPAAHPRDRVSGDLLDDESIQLLVKEVTQDVQIPTVYHPHTDYSPAPASPQRPALPLTYESLAVPVESDPFYENRFNAVASVVDSRANSNTQSMPSSNDRAERFAELERRFERTPVAEQTLAQVLGRPPLPLQQSGDENKWTYRDSGLRTGGGADAAARVDTGASRGPAGAQFASSESQQRTIEESAAGSILSSDRSVLSPLPPPDGPGAADRAKQWIRQPD